MALAPCPSWPDVPSPQQYNRPDATAHVCWYPPATAVTLVSAATSVGLYTGVVVPVPVWPTLLAPQQYNRAAVVTAHVW